MLSGSGSDGGREPSATSEAWPQKQLRNEILGPRTHLDVHRFPRIRLVFERLKSPWDAALIVGVAVALWGTALSGVILIVSQGGSTVSLVFGLPLVAISSALASHLVYRAERR